MAVTATATVIEDVTVKTGLPSGYTPPTLPTITVDASGQYTVDIAITEADPANATTGLNNVIAAVETDFETTQATALKLDVAQTIDANLTIIDITRTNTQDSADGGIFITGTEVFRCIVKYERT